MRSKNILFSSWVGPAVVLALCLFLLLYGLRDSLNSFYNVVYSHLSEPEQMTAFISSCGIAAPLVFMLLQILQVILAPVPGEFTGFIGGYLFGAGVGFFYSTIALAVGSGINFYIGRFLGKRMIQKVISHAKLARYDYLLRHQGILVVFILFLIPGFPKDYLCLLLGLSTLPVRVFILLAAVGRMPGTMMLSLQGALVFDKNYYIFGVIIVINLVMVFLGYSFRESLYRWIEKINDRQTSKIDEIVNT
jgi:uncharacterized membrane protein YdjX (TVP38/TMEM64 family)